MESPSQNTLQGRLGPGLKRLAVLAVLLGALGLFFAYGGHNYISLDTLHEHQGVLKDFVARYWFWSVAGFGLLYAALVAISFPGASLLSIFAGFLFGLVTGSIVVVLGATLGAILVFLAARYVMGESLAAKAGPFMQKFEKGLQENEISYLFILRLVPLFPFFIVNIVPALFNVKLRNYALTTLIGIIPGSIVYVSVGNGIGDVLQAGQQVPLQGLMLRPAVLLPIAGLMFLSLIPVVYKKYVRKNKA